MSYSIETRDLIKRYKQGDTALTVLNKVNMTIKKGEFMAIMGPSGSGKSTLLNMVAGIFLALPIGMLGNRLGDRRMVTGGLALMGAISIGVILLGGTAAAA